MTTNADIELRVARDRKKPCDAASEGNCYPAADSVRVAFSPMNERAAPDQITSAPAVLPAFRPVLIRGEPLSATALRDRR